MKIWRPPSARSAKIPTASPKRASVTPGILPTLVKRSFTLDYYVKLARRLESAGAHLLCIKDMAGLLKPLAARRADRCPSRLRLTYQSTLHTHDTSGIQSATYLRAIEAGADIIDVAINPLSGLTSQPGYNSVAAMMQGHERENPVDLKLLNKYADYWEDRPQLLLPFRNGVTGGHRHNLRYRNTRRPVLKPSPPSAGPRVGGTVPHHPGKLRGGERAIRELSQGNPIE